MSGNQQCAPPCVELQLMQKDVKSLTTSMESVLEKLDKLDEKMEKKYAGKWVEKIIWSASGIIGTAILLAILDQILKK